MIDTDCYCCPGCKKRAFIPRPYLRFHFSRKIRILTETANENAGNTYYKQQQKQTDNKNHYLPAVLSKRCKAMRLSVAN